MKQYFYSALRASPLVLVGFAVLVTGFHFARGGMPRVYMWVFSVMALIPILGTVGILWKWGGMGDSPSDGLA